jgi:hypothetical protein
MKRTGVVLGMVAALVVAALAVGGLAAQDPALRPVEERVERLERDTRRLESALRKSEETVATLSKQVKTIAEAQDRFARSVSVEPSGAVRITGNLRLENNVLEEIAVIPCDGEDITAKRQCRCPEGLLTIGIELRPLALSAYPGPKTYNTGLVCGRL